MLALQNLLNEYSESHQNSLNRKIHKVCVPLIEWSLLGILASIPVPSIFSPINGAHILVLFALTYYLQFKNWRVIVMSLLMMTPFWIFYSFHPEHLLAISILFFVLAWMGQFYGHKIEKRKPSFFRDVFFLLIGPLWVGESLLRSFHKSLIPKAQ